MYLLRCLIVSLCMCPVICAATPDSGVAAIAKPMAALEGSVTSTPTAGAVETQLAVLKQRVMAKWDALIQKDFASAYAFTSPGYRQSFPLQSFKGRFGNQLSWQRVEVAKVDFKGEDAATIGIYVHFRYYPPQAEKALDMKTFVEESWVLVDGQWWYLVQD